ncbi:hypothetical protein Q8814_03020 [Rhodococcus sp. CC-R104]|uniref:Uncharacterized protein n=1 Tax=Rhodococcus chondri TaxID=3065941 RepID=A0ABU7JM41_9NOCA|nr:hypothetical protein [Rhodococcus sp. CC-R104]MEE2031097.1 hypothetical protein [Rhodococcus sp. CC-R104]
MVEPATTGYSRVSPGFGGRRLLQYDDGGACVVGRQCSGAAGGTHADHHHIHVLGIAVLRV